MLIMLSAIVIVSTGALVFFLNRSRRRKHEVVLRLNERLQDARASDHSPNVGLGPETQQFVGSLLLVEPHEGYGWSRLDPEAPPEKPDPPPPFRMRLVRLTSFASSGGTRTGGFAQIEQQGHALNGFWVAFAPRWTGSWNFTSRICPSNIVIGPTEPIECGDIWAAISHGTPILAGFGEVKALESEPTRPLSF